MFCPKCGGESLEGHKFCKACGANLQLVSDALSGGDDTLGQLRADMENLKRSVIESGRSVGRAARKEWRRAAHQAKAQGWSVSGPWGVSTASGRTATGTGRSRESSSRDTALNDDSGPLEAMTFYDKRLPKPKEWLRYSRQHIVKEGLMSLLAGGAMGWVLYFLGHLAIESGTIADLEARGNVHGLAQIAAMIWVLAAVPVLKGLGQIVYGLLFGSSIKSLSQHFAPAIVQIQPPPQRQTGSLSNAGDGQKTEGQGRAAVPTQEVKPFAPPPSVTEGTTNILGEMKQSESR